MDKFKYDKQLSTELYRKWFLLNGKDQSNPYDKEQVDDLFAIIKEQIGYILEQLVNHKLYAFRAEFPFLFINGNKFDEFDVEVLVVDKTIECLSIPGCMAEADNREAAFDNLIRAIIQCSDARVKNGMWYLNRVFPMKFYEANDPITSVVLVNKLINAGWTKEYLGPYHTVLLSQGSKVTYTIQNDTVISGSMLFGYNRLQFLMSGRQFREMYGDS